MKYRLFSLFFFAILLFGVSFYVTTNAVSLGTIESSGGLNGNNNFIYNLSGLSVGTSTKTANAIRVGSGGLIFSDGSTQAVGFLGSSQSVSAGNVSQGVFGHPGASNAYSFPAALGVGTNTHAGLPTNGLFVSGNVGIGTSAPGAKLDLRGVLAMNDNPIYLRTGADSVHSIGYSSGILLQSNSPIQFKDFTSGLERVRIDLASGNVGIGTTTPGRLLDVQGDAQFGSNNWLNVIDTGAGNGRFAITGIGSMDFGSSFMFRNNTGSTEYLRITPNGGLSLGSSYVGTDPGAGSMIISGNVGIGTASPNARLQVNGTFYSPTVIRGACTGAITIDWSAGNTQHCVLTGNVTFTFSNGALNGANYRLILKQDGTGSRTVTWPGTVRWGSGGAPTLSTITNTTDYIGFLYNNIDARYDGIAFNAGF